MHQYFQVQFYGTAQLFLRNIKQLLKNILKCQQVRGLPSGAGSGSGKQKLRVHLPWFLLMMSLVFRLWIV